LAEINAQAKKEETRPTLADLRAAKFFILNRKKITCQAQEENGQNFATKKAL